MKKLFALDLNMRSTACNYDPCIISDENAKPKVFCDDCMVTFIRARGDYQLSSRFGVFAGYGLIGSS